MSENTSYFAKVAKIIDEYTIIINKGFSSDLKEGIKVLIYEVSSEKIIDPDTKQDLGFLEIVKGEGIVTYLQENMATIESSKKSFKNVTLNNSFGLLGSKLIREETKIPFKENIKVGDFVKKL